MKKADVSIGRTYVVRVSGRLTRVRVDGWADTPSFGTRRCRDRWFGTNLISGRHITGTAARLRREVPLRIEGLCDGSTGKEK